MNSLEAHFYYTAALCRSGELDELQRILREMAPTWAGEARTGRVEGRTPIDMARDGDLREIGCAAATRRGGVYQRLVAEHGRGPFERAVGLFEIRGQERSLTLVVSVDDYLLSAGPGQKLGNSVSLQVRGPRVEKTKAATWLEQLFEAICLRTQPVYANAQTTEEWFAQNMDTTSGMAAIGVDLSSSLPGLYWLNYVGYPYLPLIPKSKPGGRPEGHVTPFAGGLKIRLADDPGAWQSDGYQARTRAIRAELGDQLFFDRNDPDRRTVAPNFAALFGAGQITSGDKTATLAHPLPAVGSASTSAKNDS